MNTLLRRRIMMGFGGSPIPPEPPTPVNGAYIRGGADGSYIDTGITPDQNTKIIVWARNLNPSVANTVLFGSQVGVNDSSFIIYTATNASLGKLAMRYGDSGSTYASDAWQYMSHYHKYELGPDGFLVDDTQILSVSQSSSSNNLNIHLFGYNNNGTHIRGNDTDICACKIYKNNVLVRDFTAVNTPSVGLYDSVSNTLFTNAGSGSLTYGTFNPNAYTPLDYITTSGDSYFLTDVVGTYSLPIVVKFKATGTSKSWFDVVGGRDASNRCQIFTGNTSYSNARLYALLGTSSANTIYSSNSAGDVRNKEIIVVKSNNSFSGYYNNAAFGNTITYNVASSYSTGVPIGVGATWYENTSAWVNKFVGSIYFAGFGSQCNLVPAKVNGVAGMYDTYNDVFYSSISGTDFTAGNEL